MTLVAVCVCVLYALIRMTEIFRYNLLRGLSGTQYSKPLKHDHIITITKLKMGQFGEPGALVQLPLERINTNAIGKSNPLPHCIEIKSFWGPFCVYEYEWMMLIVFGLYVISLSPGSRISLIMSPRPHYGAISVTRNHLHDQIKCAPLSESDAGTRVLPKKPGSINSMAPVRSLKLG